MSMGHFKMPPEPPRFQGSTNVSAMVELAKAFNDSKFASQIKLLEDHQLKCEEEYKLAGTAGEIFRLREAAKQAYQVAEETGREAERQAHRLKAEATAEGEAELVRRAGDLKAAEETLHEKAQAAADRKNELNDLDVQLTARKADQDTRENRLEERARLIDDEEEKLAQNVTNLERRENDLNRRLSAFATLRSS